jgi:ATP-GRASP peptide maturase of grasp-with-spasm system
MILIFSHNDDVSTLEVLFWLTFYKVTYLRFNKKSEVCTKVELKLNNNIQNESIHIGNITLNVDNIKSVWYRAGILEYKFFFPNHHGNVNLNRRQESENYLHLRSITVQEYFDSLFHTKAIKVLGANALGRFNKIIALKSAQSVGLKIPNTIITTSKIELMDFYSANPLGIITKTIDKSLEYEEEHKKYFQYTEMVEVGDFQHIPDTFEPTLFQEMIEKEFELRVFYLAKQMFTIAIISQHNEKTKVDYRRYDKNKMNRNIPYQLPNSLCSKINAFMEKCKLNTGSLDFIYSKNGEYCFLEINPVGQFGYKSTQCGFNLEKKIADYLIT